MVKRPRDVNQLAHLILKLATEGGEPLEPPDTRNPLKVKSGRAGGLKGGKARAKALTETQRKTSASNAAKARWQAQK
jgi:hypothetical protein